MRYRLLISSMFVLAGFLSCRDGKKPKFEISNLTGTHVDSLYIEPNANLDGKYISLRPNEKAIYIGNLENEKADGSFALYYKVGRNSVFKPFGYFSNGFSSESFTEIKLLRDTVLIRQHYPKY
jgi:hypothetical protein